MQLVNGILGKEISLARVEMGLSVEKTISKPLVRTIFKDNDSLAFTFISGLVKRFVDSFGFSTKMSESQIETIAVDTFEKFEYESIEDIILFFKMARSGFLGITKRGVDSNLIFGEWFPKYMEMKSDAREKTHDRRKSENNIEQRGATYEQVLDRYQKDAEKSFKTKVVEYVDRITENMDRQILEDTILDWEKDPIRKPYVNLLKRKRKTV